MKLIIAILSLLFCMEAKSQNSLSGKITDSLTLEPLSGAIVYIPELKQGSTSNKDGIYFIDHLPEGRFLLEVKFLGYSTRASRVEIKGPTRIDIALDPTATEIHEVIITGVSSSTERKLNPVPTLVINRKYLDQSAQTNIVDAIARKPGVAQVTTGAAISKPVIRGLSFNRVVTLNNGIRQEGQQWGDEHGIEIDEYSVDRVEIIKGPGSLMYGSDAMGGVVNFLMPNPVEQGKITGNILANYQANNKLKGYSVMNAGNLKGYNWLVRMSSKNAGNYSNSYDGKVYNSGFNELNMNGYMGINRKWGYSQLHISTFNQVLGLVEGERDSTGEFIKQHVVADTVVYSAVSSEDLRVHEPEVPRQAINHFRIAGINNFILGKSSLKLNLSFQQNRRREFGDVLFPDEPQLYFLLNTFTYDIKYFFPEKRGWETSLGLNGMQQSNSNRGSEYITPAYMLLDAGVFAFAKKSFGKFHLSGGLRGDSRAMNLDALFLDAEGNPAQESDSLAQLKFLSAKVSFMNYSGSIGGSYSFTKRLTGKLNFARGFRAPNISELSSNGRHEGTFRYELGDVDLKPEVSLQSDAGLLFNSKHISLEIGLFHNHIQNYIFAFKLRNAAGQDSIADPSDPAPVFKFIHGNADLYGGEISIDIHPHPLDWLHFQNSFSIVRGIQANQPDSMKYLPFMPAPRLQSEARATLKKAGKMLKNLYLNAEFDYFFAQEQVYAAFGTETVSEGYYQLNAGAGADVVKNNGKVLFTVYLVAANLTDLAYQNNLSRLRYAPVNPRTGRQGVYNMGRNISLKVIVPLIFEKKLK